MYSEVFNPRASQMNFYRRLALQMRWFWPLVYWYNSGALQFITLSEYLCVKNYLCDLWLPTVLLTKYRNLAGDTFPQNCIQRTEEFVAWHEKGPKFNPQL